MAEGDSNDGGDDGKRKVGCDGEADDADGDDNNGCVDNNGGVDINDGNDTNDGDCMSKTDCNDDADGGGGNSHDDGSVCGNGIFGKWCVDGKDGDEVDDGGEQTESVASDLAECNGSSKMEMRVGVMR